MNDSGVLFVLGMLAGALLGGSLGVALESAHMQHDALQHGAAHYDATTGAFTWNTPATPKD